ncbi:MAG: TonB-dependent receptor, partial [Flavobacteriaceae bacterium]|nr:TonB-dependent receptor [Flavobacteriaceae bacterium]
QLKSAGNREFTETIKNTPSVYVSNQAGGFGDGQVFLRGFDDSNTAFLLNGQPINSQEDGRMFWSNWAGMADVANAVQVQRGLGSSKLAISSVGGTVNIISKTTDQREGGFVRFLAGNDSYFKGTAAYNTGLSSSGWAFSVLVDHWQAHRKYSIGTAGQGQNYLISVGYKPNEQHALNFLITGAPQWHDQNFSDDLEDYERLGEKQNSNSGFLNGERFTERRNYYHKPVANLNWDFDINDNLDLSTVLYASWGRGGGTGGLGRGRVRVGGFGNNQDEIDFDQIVINNMATSDNGVGNFSDSYIRRASVNNHNWYGLLSSLNIEAGENWNFNVGMDGRLYHGDHFRQVNDLLGLTAFQDNFRTDRPDTYQFSTEYPADPWSALFDSADEANRTQYDYSEDINYIGGFGQIEFATDIFSAFVQGAVSSQSFQREGRFVGSGDGLGKSEKLTKTGYNIKGGASIDVDPENTFFVNTGFYERQPYLDNIFADIRNSNALVEPDVENEEIKGLEGGYRFQNDIFKFDLDLYRTEWGNRFISVNGPEVGDEQTSTYRLTDVTQIHQGIEFQFQYRPVGGIWRLRAFGSAGDWKFDGTTPFTLQNNDTGNFIITDGSVDLTGVKVGNAPQTSFGAGITVDLCEDVRFDADYNFFKDLYEFVDPEDVAETALAGGQYQAMKLPSYSIVDAGLTWDFKVGDQELTFRGNVFNLFNEAYINQRDAFGYYLGIGRTYNASLRLKF